MFIMPRTCKSYIESKLLSEEEKEIFSKGISKEADDIIKKYMLDKNGKVAPTTTKESWLKYKPLLKEYLLNRFEDKSDNIKEIIYRIVNDINEKPKCPCCGNPLPFLGRPGRLYRDYCSKKCSNSSEKKINDGKETSLKKFGCISPSQTTEVKRKISDSLKINSEIRKINQKETWKRTLGVDNPMKLQRCKEKSDATKRKNDSYGKSREEEDLLYEILKKYPSTLTQYKSKYYPFKCDFYIPEKDLYIEYQGFWTHGDHPFDENNANDLEILEKWKQKEKEFKEIYPEKHTTYSDAIYTWTILDVKKKQYIKKFGLNYIALWNDDIKDIERIFDKIEQYPDVNK